MTKKKKTILYAIVVIIVLSAVVIAWPILQKPSEQEQLAAGLKLGQLAELPKDSADIKVAYFNNFFSQTVFISFKASKNDIESFIQNSPSLKKLQPQSFQYGDDSTYVFSFADGTVPWFNMRSNNARLYEIPQDENKNLGTVVIDDKADTVYIRTSHK